MTTQQLPMRRRARTVSIVITTTIAMVAGILIAPAASATDPGGSSAVVCRAWDARPGDTIVLNSQLTATAGELTREGDSCETGVLTATGASIDYGNGLATGTDVSATLSAEGLVVTGGDFFVNPKIHPGALEIDPSRNGGTITAVAEEDGVRITGGRLRPKAAIAAAGAGAVGTPTFGLQPTVAASALAAAVAAQDEPDPDMILPALLLALIAAQPTVSVEITDTGLYVEIVVDGILRLFGTVELDTSYSLNMEITNLPIGDPELGQGLLNLSGRLYAASFEEEPTLEVTGSVSGLTLAEGFVVDYAEATLTNEGIEMSADVRLACVAGELRATAGLEYRGEDDWDADVVAEVGPLGCVLADDVILASGSATGRLSGRPVGQVDGNLNVTGELLTPGLPDGFQTWAVALDANVQTDAEAPLNGSLTITSSRGSFAGSLTPDGDFQLEGAIDLSVLGVDVRASGSITGSTRSPDVSLVGRIDATFPIQLDENVQATATLTGDVAYSNNNLSLSGTLDVPCPGNGSIAFGVSAPTVNEQAVEIDVNGRIRNCVIAGAQVDDAVLEGRLTLLNGIAAFQGGIAVRIGDSSFFIELNFGPDSFGIYGLLEIPCSSGSVVVDLGLATTQAGGSGQVTGTVGPEGCELTPGLALRSGDAINGTITAGGSGLVAQLTTAGVVRAPWLPGGATDWNLLAQLSTDGDGVVTANVALASGVGSFSGNIASNGTFTLAADIGVTLNDGTTVSATGTLKRTNPNANPVLDAAATIDTNTGGLRVQGQVNVTNSATRVVGNATIACPDGGSITGTIDVTTAADGSWTTDLAGTVPAGGCRIGGTTIAPSAITGRIDSNGTFRFTPNIVVDVSGTQVTVQAVLARSTAGGPITLDGSATVNVTSNGLQLAGTVKVDGNGTRVTGSVNIPCNAGSINANVNIPVASDGTWTLNTGVSVPSTGCRISEDVTLAPSSFSGTINSNGTFNLEPSVAVNVSGTVITIAGRLERTTVGGPIELNASTTVDVTNGGTRLQGTASVTNSGTRITGTATIPCPGGGTISAGVDIAGNSTGTWSTGVQASITAPGCTLSGGSRIDPSTFTGTINSDGTFTMQPNVNLTIDGAQVSAGAMLARTTPNGPITLDATASVDITSSGIRLQGVMNWSETGTRVAGTVTYPCAGGGNVVASVDVPVAADGSWSTTVAAATGTGGCNLGNGYRINDGSFNGTIRSNGTFELDGTLNVAYGSTNVIVTGALQRTSGTGTPTITGTGSINVLSNSLRAQGTLTYSASGLRFGGRLTMNCANGNFFADVDIPVNPDGTWTATVTAGVHPTAGCNLGGTIPIIAGSVTGVLRSNGTHEFNASLTTRFGNTTLAVSGTLTRTLANGTRWLNGTATLSDTDNGITLGGTVTVTDNSLRFAGTMTLPCNGGSIQGTVDIPTSGSGTWSATAALSVATGGCTLDNGVVVNAGSNVSGTVASDGTFDLGGTLSVRYGTTNISASGRIKRLSATSAPFLEASASVDTTTNGVRAVGTLTYSSTGITLNGSVTVNCNPGTATASVNIPVNGDGSWSITAGLTIGSGGCRVNADTLITAAGLSGTINSNGTYSLSGNLTVAWGGDQVSASGSLVKSTPTGSPVLTASGGITRTGYESQSVNFVGNTQSIGGTGGNAAGPFSCPAGQVMTGATYWENPNSSSLDGYAFQGRCSSVNISGSTVTFTYVGNAPILGSAGGNAYTVNCAAGSAVVGMDVHTTSWPTYDWMRLRCAPFTFNGTSLVRGTVVDVGGLGIADNQGGSFFDNVDCGTNQLVAGYGGRVGAAIDSIFLRCHTVTRTNGLALTGTVNWSASGITLTGNVALACNPGTINASVNANVSGGDWTVSVRALTASGGCRVNPDVLISSADLSGSLSSTGGALALAVNGAVTVTTASNLVPYSTNSFTGTFSINASNNRISGSASLSGGGVSLSGSIDWYGAMNWSVSASGRIQVRGTTLNFSGTVSRNPSSGLAWSLSGSAGTIQLADNVWLQSGSFNWNTQRFAFSGQLRVACTSGDLWISASGWIANNNNWRFDVSTSANCRFGRNLTLSSSPFNGWLESSNGSVNGEFNASFSSWSPANNVWITNASFRLRIIDGWRYQGYIRADGRAGFWVLLCWKELRATTEIWFDINGRWTGSARVTLSNIQIGWLDLMYQASLEAQLRDGSIVGISV